jgi:hypothetical protein
MKQQCAEAFLRNLLLLTYSRNSPLLVESEDPLPFLQVLATGSYLTTDESSLHLPLHYPYKCQV